MNKWTLHLKTFSKAAKKITWCIWSHHKTQIEEILQTHLSLDEHVQSVLKSNLQTLKKKRNQKKAEIFIVWNKLNKLGDESNNLVKSYTWIIRNWVYRLVEYTEHRKTKVTHHANWYSHSLLTGTLPTMLEGYHQASRCKTLKHHCRANVYKNSSNEK